MVLGKGAHYPDGAHAAHREGSHGGFPLPGPLSKRPSKRPRPGRGGSGRHCSGGGPVVPGRGAYFPDGARALHTERGPSSKPACLMEEPTPREGAATSYGDPLRPTRSIPRRPLCVPTFPFPTAVTTTDRRPTPRPLIPCAGAYAPAPCPSSRRRPGARAAWASAKWSGPREPQAPRPSGAGHRASPRTWRSPPPGGAS